MCKRTFSQGPFFESEPKVHNRTIWKRTKILVLIHYQIVWMCTLGPGSVVRTVRPDSGPKVHLRSKSITRLNSFKHFSGPKIESPVLWLFLRYKMVFSTIKQYVCRWRGHKWPVTCRCRDHFQALWTTYSKSIWILLRELALEYILSPCSRNLPVLHTAVAIPSWTKWSHPFIRWAKRSIQMEKIYWR